MFDIEDNDDPFGDDDDLDLNEVASTVETYEKSENVNLTANQLARIEKNKLKALALKKSRLLSHPYNKSGNVAKATVVKEKKLVDGGGGFFIEEEEEAAFGKDVIISEVAPPIMPPDQPTCEECSKDFADSYLFTTFDHPVCDECKDMEREGPHELITKTDAKKEFLLRDSDFEKGERGDNLRFLLRKNPHNPRYGDMKLYLRLQIERRALKIWGSEEELEKEHERREENKMSLKTKKYEKKMKELRKAVRSSLFTKDISNHTHKYGQETYDEEKDEYTKVCDECGHVHTYEKM